MATALSSQAPSPHTLTRQGHKSPLKSAILPRTPQICSPSRAILSPCPRPQHQEGALGTDAVSGSPRPQPGPPTSGREIPGDAVLELRSRSAPASSLGRPRGYGEGVRRPRSGASASAGSSGRGASWRAGSTARARAAEPAPAPPRPSPSPAPAGGPSASTCPPHPPTPLWLWWNPSTNRETTK